MKSRRISVISTALLLGAVAAVATAQAPAPAAAPTPTVYNIELVVFSGNGGSSEDWSTPGAKAPAGGGDSSSGNAQVGRLVAALPASQFQLANEVARLRASGRYQILTHIAWQQTASSWGTRAGFTLPKLGSQAGGLSGLVYLERGTYLHLGVNIAYSSGGPTYRIDESRRIKFYDKQYFDHPVIGVLAMVTPSQGAKPPGR